jgi:hypothetical protein
MKRLLDYDESNGLITYHDYDHDTGKTVISYEQDVDALLDQNRAKYNDGTNGYATKAREWKHVANIPAVILLKWLSEEGIDYRDKNHWPAVRRKLNSSEYLYLRTSPGAI